MDCPPNLTLPTLLLALPALLVHPPTHPDHHRSLILSHRALTKCTTIPHLDRVLECRALTALAELGLQIGLASHDIQKAITRASLVAQNLPSLQLYRPHLAHLSSQLSLASGNSKAAQSILKRSLTSFAHAPDHAPHILYATQLALIASISASSSDDEASNTIKSLGAINDLYDLATKRAHHPVVQLASVLRLRALLRSGLWSEVGESLEAAERVLCMKEAIESRADKEGSKGKTRAMPQAVVPPPPHLSPVPSSSSSTTTATRSSFDYALIVHTLIFGVVFYTYTGDSSLANPRLKWLHELLDLQLPHFPKTGIFEIPFADAAPLYYQLTHPRVVFVLGFLVSSLAKRDLVGKKPKKKVFATEGISAVDKELRKELAFPTWASISAVQEVDHRLKKVRADLTCELIGAYIIRSEFDSAERSIDELISYTRTHNLFSSYVARITLHEAQLAHALNKHKRALECYRIAAWLSRKQDQRYNISGYHQHPYQSRTSRTSNTTMSGGAGTSAGEDVMTDGEEDLWINAAARAGELWLRIGLVRRGIRLGVVIGGAVVVESLANEGKSDDVDANAVDEREKEMEELRRIGVSVTKDCRGFGGTLEAIAEVLDSCLAKEFLKAKTHLRRAMNLSTAAQDNHLRALVLSLIASHYLYTSNQNAEKMLETAESLARGLVGVQQSQVKKGGEDGVGNAYLRLWIGERFLELYNRAGNKEGVRVQVMKNQRLMEAVGKA